MAQRTVSFPAEDARYGILPGAKEFTGVGVLDGGGPSVLCLLGAAWVQQDYIHRVLALKRQFGTRFVMTVHDLIPIYARETCDQDTAVVFEEFMRRALKHADHILAVSENTASDVKRYSASLQIPEPPITVTKNGSSFTEFLPGARVPGRDRRGRAAGALRTVRRNDRRTEEPSADPRHLAPHDRRGRRSAPSRLRRPSGLEIYRVHQHASSRAAISAAGSIYCATSATRI